MVDILKLKKKLINKIPYNLQLINLKKNIFENNFLKLKITNKSLKKLEEFYKEEIPVSEIVLFKNKRKKMFWKKESINKKSIQKNSHDDR